MSGQIKLEDCPEILKDAVSSRQLSCRLIILANNI
jgi:hypothetical protein